MSIHGDTGDFDVREAGEILPLIPSSGKAAGRLQAKSNSLSLDVGAPSQTTDEFGATPDWVHEYPERA